MKNHNDGKHVCTFACAEEALSECYRDMVNDFLRSEIVSALIPDNDSRIKATALVLVREAITLALVADKAFFQGVDAADKVKLTKRVAAITKEICADVEKRRKLLLQETLVHE